jgi:hypothetical protein
MPSPTPELDFSGLVGGPAMGRAVRIKPGSALPNAARKWRVEVDHRDGGQVVVCTCVGIDDAIRARDLTCKVIDAACIVQGLPTVHGA